MDSTQEPTNTRTCEQCGHKFVSDLFIFASNVRAGIIREKAGKICWDCGYELTH
jgi:hypothetical protein